MGVTTMAPALTDATQAIKLPESTPASSDSVSAGRQADDQASKEGKTSIPSENVTKCMIKPNGSGSADLPTVSHLNGNSLRSVQSVDKQSPAFPKLQGAVSALTLPGQIKKHIVINKSLLQNLKINATSLLCGKSGGTMSRPPAALDKEGEKYQGHGAQNRTHSCRQLGGTAGGGNSQYPTGNHLYAQKPGGSMCPNSSAAGDCKPASQSTIPSNHFHAGVAMNHKHLKCTNVSTKPGVSLPVATTSDGHEVDMTVLEQYDEAAKKHAQLERRIEFLQRRQKRVQARLVEQHILKEASSFVDYHQQNLQTVSALGNKSSPGFPNSDDLNKELLSDGAKHMSTAALVSLVHKMQKQGSTSQLPVLSTPAVTTVLNMSHEDCKDSQMVADKLLMNLRMMQSALDSDTTESSSGGETDGEDGPADVSHPVPATTLSRRAEWKWMSERSAIASKWTWLQAQVSDLEYRIRQQTESYRLYRSSKGPVVLEEPSESHSVEIPRNQPVLVGNHDGRTAVVPSSVLLQGSRQLLSSHLPQLVRCSSSVTGGVLSSHPTMTLLHSHSGALQSRLTTTNPPLNVSRRDNGEDGRSSGVHANSSSSSSTPPLDVDPATDPSCRATRCLPLVQALRKRKLVRTSGLEFKSSAKAAKLSSVKCHCHQAMTPCVLCSGKGKRIQTIDPHYMSFPQRVGLMDASNHPVLSFSEEVPLSVHFEGLLRSSCGEWQNKAGVRRPRAEQGQRSQKAGKLSSHGEGRKALLRKNQSSVIIQSAKIRNKYEQKAGRKVGPAQGLTLNNRTLSADLKCLNHAPFSVGRGRGRGRGRRRRGQGGRGGYLRHGFDRQSYISTMGDCVGGAPYPREREVRRRRGESAFDINSIVIPRSIAATTRPEKLEYKEIPTPSWRYLKEGAEEEQEEPEPEPEPEAEVKIKVSVPAPESNGLNLKDNDYDSDETEDLMDDVYIHRHDLCEMAEKKRFSSAVRAPHHHHRRRRVGRAALPPLYPSTPTPLSMGTQVSMDTLEVEEDVDLSFVERLGCSGTSVSTFAPPNGDGVGHVDGEGSRLGSSSSLPEVESPLSPGAEGLDPVFTRWPPRQFPLTDEEVSQLEKEDLSLREEENEAAPRPNLHAVSRSIQNLRPHPVEVGGSQAGSSVSSSQPPSPLPSTSSASLAEDWDAGDVEWTLDSDTVKKKALLQSKGTKR